MFFQSRFLDPFFLICFLIFPKWSILRPPSKSDGIQNGSQNRPMGAQSLKKLNSLEATSRPWFSRNHSDPCAVWTSWLWKGHFFYVDWLNVCFCCVSLCFVLYKVFDICFLKTSVNAQPLGCLVFEGIAAHKTKEVRFSFLCLRLRFFYFFIFLLISEYPLPTPWARLALFWIDFVAFLV